MAIAMAEGCRLVLTDDRRAVKVARDLGLEVFGTLGVLVLASRRGLIQLRPAFELLRGTNFRCTNALLDEILAREESSRP